MISELVGEWNLRMIALEHPVGPMNTNKYSLPRSRLSLLPTKYEELNNTLK